MGQYSSGLLTISVSRDLPTLASFLHPSLRVAAELHGERMSSSKAGGGAGRVVMGWPLAEAGHGVGAGAGAGSAASASSLHSSAEPRRGGYADAPTNSARRSIGFSGGVASAGTVSGVDDLDPEEAEFWRLMTEDVDIEAVGRAALQAQQAQRAAAAAAASSAGSSAVASASAAPSMHARTSASGAPDRMSARPHVSSADSPLAKPSAASGDATARAGTVSAAGWPAAGASSAVAATTSGAGLPAGHVPCPICRVGPLVEFAAVVACRSPGCSFKLDTHNGLTLADLRARLAAVYAEHASRCVAVPQFRLEERFGIKALYIGCVVCEDLQVVL